MSTPNPNVLALLKLLSDDNREIVETAKAKLLEIGPDAVPYLEEAAKSHEDPKVRVEAKGLLEQIRLTSVGREWERAATSSDQELDLEQGVFLLAKVPYPQLDQKRYQQMLDQMAEQIRPKLKSTMRPKAQFRVLNQYLFKEIGFRGNWDDYFDPQNSYLNCVLDRKLGIPISLSVLYLLLARRLKLPLEGVGIPGHFMIKYKEDGEELYIDAFNQGRFLTRAECILFIVEAGYPYQRDFLEGVGPREILARMLRNLILIYVDRQEETLERILTRFLNVLYPETEGEVEPEEDTDLPGEEGEEENPQE